MIDIKRQEEAFEKLNRFKELNTLNNLSSKISDGIHSTPKYATDGTIPFVNGNNIRNGVLLLQNVEKFIDEEEYELYKIQYLPGAILISLNGTIGEVGIYNNEKVLFGKSIGYINCTETLNNIFLMHYLKTEMVKSTFKKELTGSTIKNLSLNTLKNLKVPTYSSDKQIHIGNFLTSLDDLIQKQEEYIEELKVQKQGIIKHLMFDESNREFKLSELGKFKKGSGLSKEDVTDFGVNKCILYGELFTKYSEEIRKVYSMTDKEGNYISNGKEVLIPGSTTTGAREIAIARSLCEKDIIIGSDTIVFECNERVDNRYLAYYLTHIGWEEIAQKAVGITIIHLYGKDIANNKVLLPDKLKQKNISNLLSLLEDKINLNGKKLEQLKLKKKYYLNKIF